MEQLFSFCNIIYRELPQLDGQWNIPLIGH